MTAMERTLVRALPWLGAGVVASPILLLFDEPSDLLAASTIHLSVVVGLAIAAAVHLAPLADDEWFTGTRLSAMARRFASAVFVVVVVTGITGLVTLASSAALRFQPSLQFLQLLSALDIAWAGAAIVVGGYRWGGKRAAWGSGAVLAIVCVWAIWRYLDTVGFTADGGWLVDGDRLMTLVIPYDMAAAVGAVLILIGGTRRSQPIEQPRTQS